MARVMTAEVAAQQLRVFAESLVQLETVKGMRQVLKTTRKKAIADYKKSGLGGALWGKRKRGGPPLILKSNTARFSKSGDGFTGGFTAKGMAGIIEKGGRTKGHDIEAKASVLVFEGKTGLVFTQDVDHPGGPVKKNDALTDAMAAAALELGHVLDVRYSRAAKRVL